MGGQNSKQEVPVNNVGNMSNQGPGKQKIGSVLANQNKRHDGGQGKANEVQCWCPRPSEVEVPQAARRFQPGMDSVQHLREAKEDGRLDSAWSGCDAPGSALWRCEEPLPPMADSRREIELPDDESTKSIEDILFNDDDEVEEDMMQFSPALVADTTATPRMETVAASMKSLSVELDQ
ncbi:hypothetical protein AeMF1_008758, partial [Aphanomyces euteiches]